MAFRFIVWLYYVYFLIPLDNWTTKVGYRVKLMPCHHQQGDLIPGNHIAQVCSRQPVKLKPYDFIVVLSPLGLIFQISVLVQYLLLAIKLTQTSLRSFCYNSALE